MPERIIAKRDHTRIVLVLGIYTPHLTPRIWVLQVTRSSGETQHFLGSSRGELDSIIVVHTSNDLATAECRVAAVAAKLASDGVACVYFLTAR
jgi:hypothetical protein